MEPQADPVAPGQKNEPVEPIHGDADGERPEVFLEGEIAKDGKAADQNQVQEDSRRPAAASSNSQASGDLSGAEPDDEAPVLAGERDHGVREGDACHPVEPAGAKPASTLELLL